MEYLWQFMFKMLRCINRTHAVRPYKKNVKIRALRVQKNIFGRMRCVPTTINYKL